MSLRFATPTRALPPGPPYACGELTSWAGHEFDMPTSDGRLRAIHDGGPEPTAPLANLAGAFVAWRDWPQHMDFMLPESPAHAAKMLERQLYLDLWERWIAPGCRVLDLGGGIGRFTHWCLDRGCDVELVDPDLRSLQRAVTHAIGRAGRLDVHWATGELIPELAPVDVVIGAELLCYVEDIPRVLANIRRALKPGGLFLASVEARWGWALAMDVPPGTLGMLLEDGVVHIPGDRWVRTFTGESFREAVSDWEILALERSHYIWSGPFEDAAGTLDIDAVRLMERRLRDNPVTAPLNRAWMAVLR